MQILNSGCVHTKPNEIQAVDLNQKNETLKIKNTSIPIEYLVYRSSQFPLADFFRGLKKGEYKEAFQRMDLRYRSSNFNNPALQELIDAGFIPVYVKIENKTVTPLSFDEKSFVLVDGSKTLTPIAVTDLPREFEHFSQEALAANVYNTGVVVVGFAAVLGVLVIATAGNGLIIPNNWGGGGGNSKSHSGLFSDSEPIYNDLQKTTKVDYRNYLIQSSTLKSGESAQGLVFFLDPQSLGERNYKLEFVSKK